LERIIIDEYYTILESTDQ
jgi:superfamily II DNA helicase RecQ